MRLSQRDEPPKKMSKLAIAAETEEDRYETKSEIKCYACQVDDIDKESGKVCWRNLVESSH